MEYNVPSLNRLIEQFQRLPGIGRKSAQRLAFYVLSMPGEKAIEFAETIINAQKKIRKCSICKNLCDTETCPVCSDSQRDPSIICVVESPKDVMAFERTGEFNGRYHVLYGLISPIDNIGPDQLYIKELVDRIKSGDVKEVIMATNPTAEGEATAMYISTRLLKPLGVKVTRLAYGIPIGGNLEYADEMTLCRALDGRSEL